MPRKPRYFLPNVPVHVVQRGHSRSPVFFEAQDYATYSYWVKEAALRYEIDVHAFVLMTNHVHLLMTPKLSGSVSKFMQYVGRRYVPYFNHKYGKSGSIWEGRFKASLVQDDRYLLTVMRYIELNPVRALMVELPSQYRWSSYVHNIAVREISFVKYHSVYMNLGANQDERVTAYKDLFKSHIDKEVMLNIGRAWQTGTPLVNDDFKRTVEEQLGKKVGHDRRGRPGKRALTP
ncbi:transposase [Oceanicoccus sp. KOV_DT_Chl]|uniref:transposase n=1 Tax=Oceanicoccus sp. KOV_DT_Chl TaxID=1904639 RepID=UPI000C7A1547|nr:transposase [Oceanicoccus sp. KOV_DT_Chl]